MRQPNRYTQILEHIFFKRYQPGMREVEFRREDIERAAAELGIALPKNLGDVIYSFRYRVDMPSSIANTAGEGEIWTIRPGGRSSYRFALTVDRPLLPNPLLVETKLPDATPGIITRYALNDEQALLARLRYNRLIDIFTGTTCYALQSHLRTTVAGLGQVETDEVYIGVDKRGVQYVFPVQAKGGRDRLNIVQIEQDQAMCEDKFPALLCRPIGAQFIDRDLIALFEFELGETGFVIAAERHYRLVLPDDLSDADLQTYRQRPFE